MYRFHDADKNGRWEPHKFDKEETIWGFWIFLILGFVIPIGIAIYCV